MALNIKFQHNWNGKLFLPYFTTIRRNSHEKARYYKSNIGNTFTVLLEGVDVVHSKLIHVEETSLFKIPKGLLHMDTGCEDPGKLFKNFGIEGSDGVLILTFERTDKK